MIEAAVRPYPTSVMKGYFQRAIWPLTIVAALFGFALIEHPWGKPRRLLSLFYATVVFSLQVALYLVKEVLFRYPHAIFIRSVGNFIMFCCCLISLLTIFLTHWHGKRYERCLAAIGEIDETLRNLGMETDYSKLRRAVVVALIAWVTWSCLLNMMDSMLMTADRMGLGFSILFPLLFDTPLHLLILIDMHFWCVVGYAGTRFDCINSALKKLMFDDNDCVEWFRNDRIMPVLGVFVPDEKHKRTIWTIMHLQFQMCKTLRSMHRVFEVQISLQMNFCCVYILCSIIFTFRMILLPFEGDKLQMAVLIWIWALPFFANIVITNQICENVSAKATSVGHTTVKLLRLMDEKEMCEDVSFVLLQIKHRPVKFSNLGNCDFGHRHIHEIFSSIVTMVVIILQLKTGLQT